MTTELEEQFFKVFGIEPTIYSLWDSKETQIKNFKSYEVYPEITYRVLLELIVVLVNNCANYHKFQYDICARTIETIKEQVLRDCIDAKDDIKQQIQQLFKEEQ